MEKGIESLEPLRNLKNLRILSMINGAAPEGSYRSMEPISGLTQLESLEIGIRRQSDVDLSCLSGLTKLSHLSIDCNVGGGGDPIIDLTPLENLTELRTLDLSLAQIRDLTPLASLPNLQSVTILGPENLDTTPLAHVPSVNVN